MMKRTDKRADHPDDRFGDRFGDDRFDDGRERAPMWSRLAGHRSAFSLFEARREASMRS